MPNRRYAPATQRNRDPILNVLRRVLPESGQLLEIASGTGEHAAYIAPRLPEGWSWQPSDADADALPGIDAHAAESRCPRIRPAIAIDVRREPWPIAAADAVFCANMIHIAPWSAAEGLFRGASRLLAPGLLASPGPLASAPPLILCGPFKRAGAHTAPSNAAFDASLQSRDPAWGVRCLDTEVVPLAAACGFALGDIVPMPANNLTVVFRRRPA